ncbi:hypothetical protein POM88_026808 [Heracleum sosnowskyi]|uniref:DUF4283 domain-containing protein n=1 Tax=Heracleum sosnowskyi TaxID=360622 RepID=A0AAD8I6J9_9APIA|nr:hypothetical protein POM88_026808 [Heracleum sosnowskyi]
MEEAFAAIQIEDEEYGGLSYENDNEDLSEMEMRWCLTGRFLTDSHIDFQAMQHKMASLWRQGRGLYVKQLDSNRFIFQFYHEIDINRVIDGSPWTFGRFHLVMERLKDGDNPRTIEINKIDLWVQLHGMKPKRRSHTMGSKWLRNGGNSQGHFSGDGGKSEGDKGNPVNGAQGKQNNDNLGANSLVINKGDLAGDIGGKIEGINQKGSK